jgi:hypothetical protein
MGHGFYMREVNTTRNTIKKCGMSIYMLLKTVSADWQAH